MRIHGHALRTLALLTLAGALVACGGGDDGVGPPPPPAQLTTEARAALDEALQDAYRTYYTYQAVMADFGAGAPFSAIAATELADAGTLVTLYTSRGVTPPAAIWNVGNVPRFTDRAQACMAAEEGEVATELMFERLMRANLPNDVRGAFASLRTTARQTHRVAFRACVGGTIPPATASVAAAMAEALQDEYRAFYTYGRVVADLGSVVPFPVIRDAEWLHIGAVANLYVKRDLAVPASTWTLDNVPRYATRQAACAAGVAGENANVLMYDRLLLQSLPPDVERVFENLREASLERHLPAFQLCD